MERTIEDGDSIFRRHVLDAFVERHGIGAGRFHEPLQFRLQLLHLAAVPRIVDQALGFSGIGLEVVELGQVAVGLAVTVRVTDVLPFVGAQIAGALLALFASRVLFPEGREKAERI